jgi:transcriptional regulator GlxA family with amidase domain
MRDNLHKEVSLSELAQSVNLSVWRLGHIFRSEVGMAPIKYLRLLRMERARQLLETSYLSIKEIGYHVGLNDESHFVRDFKKAYGAPPTLYRTRFNGGQSKGSGNRKDSTGEVHRAVAKAAKQGALISLNLLPYLFSVVESLA